MTKTKDWFLNDEHVMRARRIKTSLLFMYNM